jgi:hypothetical protein
MKKHNKDLESMKMKRDSLHVTLKQTNANYWKLKAKNDSLSVKHNKLFKNYKSMEQIFSKQ